MLGYARNFFLSSSFITSSRNLHDNALEGLVKTKTKFFDNNPSGRMITRFTKDTAICDDMMPTV